MTTLEDLTREQRSLLLFLETCAVDHAGRIDTRRMNVEDQAQLREWGTTGFVQTGRIASQHCTGFETVWVRLSVEAMAVAHQERTARSERMWAARKWLTTEEKRQV